MKKLDEKIEFAAIVIGVTVVRTLGLAASAMGVLGFCYLLLDLTHTPTYHTPIAFIPAYVYRVFGIASLLAVGFYIGYRVKDE